MRNIFFQQKSSSKDETALPASRRASAGSTVGGTENRIQANTDREKPIGSQNEESPATGHSTAYVDPVKIGRGEEIKKVFSVFFIVVLAFIATNTGLVVFGATQWNNTPLGVAYNSVRHAFMGTEGKTEKTKSGETLFVSDPNKVREYGYGNIKYVPEPAQSFENAKCDMTPRHEVTTLAPNSWKAPSINAGSELVINGDKDHPATIPDAPKGVIKGDGAMVDDKTGAVDIAGHVDYSPGVKSAQGGEFSEFGKLKNLSSCDHIYVSNNKGDVQEVVVVDLKTKDQKSLKEDEDAKKPEEREYFRKTGQKKFFFFTCSGPSISDSGGEFQFNYRDNLVVGALPVS